MNKYCHNSFAHYVRQKITRFSPHKCYGRLDAVTYTHVCVCSSRFDRKPAEITLSICGVGDLVFPCLCKITFAFHLVKVTSFNRTRSCLNVFWCCHPQVSAWRALARCQYENVCLFRSPLASIRIDRSLFGDAKYF